ncbi:tryptophan-rich sensory protein [Geomicrobium sp. JSM 1781026]|uniref:tryptophan-rich sensory protein n=1 Tax=Geomicrobium sp. JSM 1781026 TaxID=3344580 RepID=UPI0035C2661B
MNRTLSKSAVFIMLFALVVVVVVNAMANGLPINGQTTGEIADQIGLLFIPPGYVFSIWGLIYVLLLIWLAKFMTSNGRRKSFAPALLYPFLGSALGNVGWLISFHYEWFYVTMLFMLLLLFSLIRLHWLISNARDRGPFDLFPISVYIGWISIATILNVGIVLVAMGVDPIEGIIVSGQVWTIIVLIIGVVLAVTFMNRCKDAIYPLVFIWAYIGIGIERAEGFEIISMTCWILVVVMSIMTLIHLIKRR